MPRVYVSVGSNMDREKNIRGAFQALARRFGDITASTVYQTKAEGFDGEDFYNFVAGFDTDEPLETVRDVLATVETNHGRTRGGDRYGPRTLDIDVLLYGDLIRHEGRIDVPRGEILKFGFVLGPLAEIAPERQHPETGEHFKDLWQRFENKSTLQPVQLDFND